MGINHHASRPYSPTSLTLCTRPLSQPPPPPGPAPPTPQPLLTAQPPKKQSGRSHAPALHLGLEQLRRHVRQQGGHEV